MPGRQEGQEGQEGKIKEWSQITGISFIDSAICSII
jgi:hypothetical protein